MLVHIVIVPTPDRSGPDLTRIGTLEDIPDDLARVMLNSGTARLPTDDELAARPQGEARVPVGGQPAKSTSRRDAAAGTSDGDDAPVLAQ